MNKRITILLPAYNEEDSLDLLYERMHRVVQDNEKYDWQFLLINDGSTDSTLDRMALLHEQDSEHFDYLDLSRNFGKEAAMLAGIDYAQGDALIIMDADMQHPIDVIPQMISKWEEGYDDVYAVRRSSKENWFKRTSSRWYYRLLQKMTDVPIQQNTGDFRLLDRSCIDALQQLRENERNTKGLYSWIGFRKTAIEYDQQERKAGKSKWSTIQLMRLAMNGLTGFTVAPLRISVFFGIVVSLAAFIYLLYILIHTLLYGDPVAGYPTIMVTILFLGGIQLLSIGIIGEYLGKIFHETKHRPGYFVRTYNGKKDHNKYITNTHHHE